MNEQEKREKVIKGMECCQDCDGYVCRNCCPYHDRNEPEGQPTCTCRLAHDALALLKAQEPVVRCRDCKYYNTTGCGVGFGWCEDSVVNNGTCDDFYCARGERGESE